MTIIIEQVLILSVMIAIGYFAYARKILKEDAKEILGQVVMQITFPLLVITKISNTHKSPQMFTEGAMVVGLTFGMIGLLLLTGIVSARLLRLKGTTKNAYTAHMMFGNVGFLAYPLFDAMFPNGQGILYAVLYNLVNDLFLWTVGIYYLTKHQNETGKSSLSHLVNPTTAAFFIGVIMLIWDIKLPYILNESLSRVGQATVPLSMIYIGISLAMIHIKGILKKPYVFVASFLKLLVVPLIAAFLLKGFAHYSGFHFAYIPIAVTVLQGAMPAMATVVVIARQYGSDDIYTAENVLISHIACLATLPVMAKILQILFA
ncbi:MAG: AEC family transporter [Hyphomonadaceae bacterium]|nr:AEC family transporter [Clostridia bacterium]